MHTATAFEIERSLDKLFPLRRCDRVLLVAPPYTGSAQFRYEVGKRGRYMNNPPYGLLLIASHLRSAGTEVRICDLHHAVLEACRNSDSEAVFDFDATWETVLDEAVSSFRPEAIGVGCLFTMSHGALAAVCRRSAGYGVPVLAGGVHVTGALDAVLDDIPEIQVAFLKEADLAVVNFVRAVRGELPPEAVGQVVFNLEGSRLHAANECRPDAAQSDVLPAYDLAPISERSSAGTVGSFYWLRGRGARVATALSSRGCRGQCTFCSVRNFNGSGVRQRGIASVVDELERLEQTYGIEHITWLDDDLLFDHRRAIDLFGEMVRRRLKLTWEAANGLVAASCLDDVIAAAAESGCIAAVLGMESGNREILRSVRKPGTVDTFLRAAEVLRRHPRIHSDVFLMIGFPGETFAMVRDTVNVARRMNLDWYRINALQPLPGTPLYISMAAQGLVDSRETSQVRFQTGSYGKQVDAIEKPLDDRDPRDLLWYGEGVPSAEQIDDLWLAMNFELNFARIPGQTDPVRLNRLRALLTNLFDFVAPDHALALFYLAGLQLRQDARVDPSLMARLQHVAVTSEYWSHTLARFGCSLSGLPDPAAASNPSDLQGPVLSGAA